MNRAEFQAVIDRTLDDLPEWVVDKIDNLVVVVEESPPDELEGSLGVYDGTSLLDRSADYWGVLPDRIVVYQQPHMELRLGRAELEAEIRKTILHEIGHHIGIDDNRLNELGWD